jgi:hypothetical protein
MLQQDNKSSNYIRSFASVKLPAIEDIEAARRGETPADQEDSNVLGHSSQSRASNHANPLEVMCLLATLAAGCHYQTVGLSLPAILLDRTTFALQKYYRQ